MAQNTESSGTGLQPYRSPYGHFPIRGYQQTTNSTFVAGHVVERNTSTDAHRITTASSNSTMILGVVAEAGSSNAASGAQDGQRVLPVYEARPEIEFRGWIKEVIASTMVGEVRGFHRDSSVNIDVLGRSTGAARVQITEVGSDSNQSAKNKLASIGDTNGYVAFRFLPEYTQFGQSSPPVYVVEYSEPTMAASTSALVAASSHADFTTSAVYVFSPTGTGSSNSPDFVIGEAFVSTATELRLHISNPSGSTLSGSTRRGVVTVFKGRVAGN